MTSPRYPLLLAAIVAASPAFAQDTPPASPPEGCFFSYMMVDGWIYDYVDFS